MQSLNDEVYVLDGLEDDLRGKQSSTDRFSHRTTYPQVRKVPDLGFQIVAIGRAPFAVPDGVRTDYAYFVGPAIVAVTGESEVEDEGSMTPFGGLANLTITQDRVLGVLMPDQKVAAMLGGRGGGKITLNRAAIGFATPRSEIKVSSSGSQGLFKKRPSSISLEGSKWDCHLVIAVSRIRISEVLEPRLQRGQENALLEALA
jgi:hypothetical protein